MIDVVTALFFVPLGFQHVLLLSHFVGLAPEVLESIREKEAKMEAVHSEEVQLDVVQLLHSFLGERLHGAWINATYIIMCIYIYILYTSTYNVQT